MQPYFIIKLLLNLEYVSIYILNQVVGDDIENVRDKGSKDVRVEDSEGVGTKKSESTSDRSINLDDFYDNNYVGSDAKDVVPRAKKVGFRVEQAELKAKEGPRGEASKPRTEEGESQHYISLDYAQFRDLYSHDSSHEEKYDTFDVFREETDLANVQFKLGMKFKSFALLKVAIRWYVIKGEDNVKLVKNDKVRVEQYAKRTIAGSCMLF